MPSVNLTKDECSLLRDAMVAGIEQAETEIKSFDKNAKSEDVTAALVARSLMQMVHYKMIVALDEK